MERWRFEIPVHPEQMQNSFQPTLKILALKETLRFPEPLSTGRTNEVIRQFFSAFAHPAGLPGRVADHQGVIGYVFCDNRPGGDEGVTADCSAADDGAVGPEGGAFFDEGGAHLVHLADFGAGVEDVREDHRRAAKDAVFEGDAFIDGDIILYFALVAYGYIGADDDILADRAVFADSGAGEDVGEMPDFCSFAHKCAMIDVG